MTAGARVVIGCTGVTWDTTAIRAVCRVNAMSTVHRVKSVRLAVVSVLVNPTTTDLTATSAPTDTTTSQNAPVSTPTHLLVDAVYTLHTMFKFTFIRMYVT